MSGGVPATRSPSQPPGSPDLERAAPTSPSDISLGTRDNNMAAAGHLNTNGSVHGGPRDSPALNFADSPTAATDSRRHSALNAAPQSKDSGLPLKEESKIKLASFPGGATMKRNKSGIATASFKGKVGRRLAELDNNGDGVLDAEELTAVVEKLLDSERDRRLLKWMLGSLFVLFLALIGVTAGLTYGIVQASKDTKMDESGTILDKRTGEAAVTASERTYRSTWQSLAQPDNEEALQALSSITLVGSKGRVRMDNLNVLRSKDDIGTTTIMLSNTEGLLTVNVTSDGNIVTSIENPADVEHSSGLGLVHKMQLIGLTEQQLGGDEAGGSGSGNSTRRRLLIDRTGAGNSYVVVNTRATSNSRFASCSQPSNFCNNGNAVFIDCDYDGYTDVACLPFNGNIGVGQTLAVVRSSDFCQPNYAAPQSFCSPASNYYNNGNFGNGNNIIVVGCNRPNNFCYGNGAVLSSYDCDGDGTKDFVCYDSFGQRGVVYSGRNCYNSWPSAYASDCPAVFNAGGTIINNNNNNGGRACTAPAGNWCFGTVVMFDCDLDNSLDVLCVNSNGNHIVIRSANNCQQFNGNQNICQNYFIGNGGFNQGNQRTSCNANNANNFCFNNGGRIVYADCDNDGLTDAACVPNNNNFNGGTYPLMLSSNFCSVTSGTCAAAFGNNNNNGGGNVVVVTNCQAPTGWCINNGGTVVFTDCDNDGFTDAFCVMSNSNSFLIISSSNFCQPSTTNRNGCLAAFNNNNNNNGCNKPFNFCVGVNSVSQQYDCDKDGILDWTCVTSTNVRGATVTYGIVKSTEDCAQSVAVMQDCPAVFRQSG